MMTRPLEVLYVMHSGSLAGSAESLRLLLEHFPSGAVHATVLCPDGDAVALLRRQGVDVRIVPGISMFHSIEGIPLRGVRLIDLARTLWFMRHGRHIRHAIRETRPDVVHLNERGMLHAAWVAHREGVPVVLHARSVADRQRGWVWRISRWAIRRHVARVVAIDESVRSSLEELENVDVIYNPVDSQEPTGVSPEKSQSTPPIRVTYLTGLQVFKGVFDLLRCAVLLRHRSDIVFHVAGVNSRPDTFHRSVLGRLLHALGLAQDVESHVRRWVASQGLETTVKLMGRVEPGAALAETDILVFPSHLDGPGRSVFEAGVRGIPSIVALRRRIEDVVVDGETGLIVPPGSPEALAQSIVRLADDPALRRRLGENARARYHRQFAPRRIAGQVLDLYRTLAGQMASADGSTVGSVHSDALPHSRMSS